MTPKPAFGGSQNGAYTLQPPSPPSLAVGYSKLCSPMLSGLPNTAPLSAAEQPRLSTAQSSLSFEGQLNATFSPNTFLKHHSISRLLPLCSDDSIAPSASYYWYLSTRVSITTPPPAV